MFMMRSFLKVARASVGVVLLVWLLWFLLAGNLASHPTKRSSTAFSSTRNVDIFKLIESHQSHTFHKELPDVYHEDKRRVPNGPNPIHNRRAWNSRVPPTRA